MVMLRSGLEQMFPTLRRRRFALSYQHRAAQAFDHGFYHPFDLPK